MPVSVKLIRDVRGRSKGYGFVTMDSSTQGMTELRDIIRQVHFDSLFVYVMSVTCVLDGSWLFVCLFAWPVCL